METTWLPTAEWLAAARHFPSEREPSAELQAHLDALAELRGARQRAWQERMAAGGCCCEREPDDVGPHMSGCEYGEVTSDVDAG